MLIASMLYLCELVVRFFVRHKCTASSVEKYSTYCNYHVKKEAKKLKKEQKISIKMVKAYETRLFALEIFSKTFIGKKS